MEPCFIFFENISQLPSVKEKGVLAFAFCWILLLEKSGVPACHKHEAVPDEKGHYLKATTTTKKNSLSGFASVVGAGVCIEYSVHSAERVKVRFQ